jgi:hypothetical protein
VKSGLLANQKAVSTKNDLSFRKKPVRRTIYDAFLRTWADDT